eukprot:750001-Hanusia_phi.AAC.4
MTSNLDALVVEGQRPLRPAPDKQQESRSDETMRGVQETRRLVRDVPGFNKHADRPRKQGVEAYFAFLWKLLFKPSCPISWTIAASSLRKVMSARKDPHSHTWTTLRSSLGTSMRLPQTGSSSQPAEHLQHVWLRKTVRTVTLPGSFPNLNDMDYPCTDGQQN